MYRCHWCNEPITSETALFDTQTHFVFCDQPPNNNGELSHILRWYHQQEPNNPPGNDRFHALYGRLNAAELKKRGAAEEPEPSRP